jgi:hypothetical protein
VILKERDKQALGRLFLTSNQKSCAVHPQASHKKILPGKITFVYTIDLESIAWTDLSGHKITLNTTYGDGKI